MGRTARPRTRAARWLVAGCAATLAAATVATGLGAGAASAGSVAKAAAPRSQAKAQAAPTPRVLRVGTYKGMAGDYTTIQAAVDAAQPGDWILVGPGDYHEQQDHAHPENDDPRAGLLIKTPNIHLRGMDRNAVVVDGTKPGSPQCSSAEADQDPGVVVNGNAQGRSGLVVSKVDGVAVENLTACNFIGGGNEIWFNGGDGSGKIGMGSYYGAYLSATSTYWGGYSKPRGAYGIFVSNAKGPGLITKTYASNMDDSAYYIGACGDCNVVLDQAHGENSALGYSGTNSGGHLAITNGEWDENKTGIVTNSQNNDDAPSPQDGTCPGQSKVSCWTITGNYVHDNNNPNVPAVGSADFGPVGTGIVVSGGRWDQVKNNRIENQGSWGILFVPFPDQASPPQDQLSKCQGGNENFFGIACYYDDWGNEGAYNTFKHVGYFGNETNGDLGDISFQHIGEGNWWHNNTNLDGALTTAPANLEVTHGQQFNNAAGALATDPLGDQVLCATQALGPCPDDATHHYPRVTQVALKPMPAQTTMPDPCVDVPANPWCPAKPVTPVTPETPAATPVVAEPRFTG